MPKERLVVICPGRGSYTRESSGYLDSFKNIANKEISWMNSQREALKLPILTDLDSNSFKTKTHMIGINASPLIYACSYVDFLSIDRSKYEIVAITGNSMGWYTTLALSGVLSFENAFKLINTMSSLTKDDNGGQIIYPIVNENWQIDESINKMILKEVEEAGAYVSIKLGGYIVIAGKQDALNKLLKKLPISDKYPFQLPFHSAYHTPIMSSVPEQAFRLLPESLFLNPNIHIVDGRGHIWSPYSTKISELYRYTLKYQVTKTYDFNSAINVAIKEFCPDKLILLGPGNTLGGSIAQILIQNSWLDIDSKKSFINKQNKDPYLISMSIKEQRKIVS
jgi:[acyl-carrier-protein] S-malonyltransferase